MYLRSYSVRLTNNRFRNSRELRQKKNIKSNSSNNSSSNNKIHNTKNAPGNKNKCKRVGTVKVVNRRLLNILRSEGYDVYKCIDSDEEDNYGNVCEEYDTHDCHCEECTEDANMYEEQDSSEDEIEEIWNRYEKMCDMYD
jgi:hypothetical protein